jgi:hypothetical protein
VENRVENFRARHLFFDISVEAADCTNMVRRAAHAERPIIKQTKDNDVNL